MTGTRATAMTTRVMSNVVGLRRARGWAAKDLAAHATAVYPDSSLTRDVLANMEAGYRSFVVLEELAALAAALGMDPWSLTSEPVCLTCRNTIPPGLVCSNCRRSGVL